MTEPMTLEQVRDWLRDCAISCTKSSDISNDFCGQMADAIDAHLAQPAQAVDVGDESLERALRELLAGRGLYVVRPEHIKDTTRPLNTIKYGMVMNGKVLFTCKEPSALTGEKAGPVDGWRGLTGDEQAKLVGQIVEFGTKFVTPLFIVIDQAEAMLRERNTASPAPDKEGQP